MGGGSYDRTDYDSSSSWGSRTSYLDSFVKSAAPVSSPIHVEDKTTYKGSLTLSPEMFPDKVITSTSKNPIIVVLDVTGSNIEFAKIVWDKMPMFYGQIILQGYLSDIDFSICAVGDAFCDKYPLQIADFARGVEIDKWLNKIVLEGKGGAGITESYELLAYYLYKNAKFSEDANPIVFFIGDEIPYNRVHKSLLNENNIPYSDEDKEALENPFSALRKKVNDNVFMILKPYKVNRCRTEIIDKWEKLLAPNHVLHIGEDADSQKSIIDVMLGVIAGISNTRDLNSYVEDMRARDQTDMRIEKVKSTLSGVFDTLTIANVKPEDPKNVTTEAGTRL